MTWEEAVKEMDNGNIITIPNTTNYCFMFRPNHLLVYCEFSESLYHFSKNNNISSLDTYVVDNSKRAIIDKLIEKENKHVSIL